MELGSPMWLWLGSLPIATRCLSFCLPFLRTTTATGPQMLVPVLLLHCRFPCHRLQVRQEERRPGRVKIRRGRGTVRSGHQSALLSLRMNMAKKVEGIVRMVPTGFWGTRGGDLCAGKWGVLGAEDGKGLLAARDSEGVLGTKSTRGPWNGKR